MRAVSIPAVILAAGASRRLGRPKQEVVLHGETLLHRAVRVAAEAGLEPVLVVVRDPASTIDLEALGAVVLVNERASEGMSTSIYLGVRWAQDHASTGIVLLTCDQPALRSTHLRALSSETAHITGSAYAGRVGVPAYFPASAFDALLTLRGDQGARPLLGHARAIADEALALDIDTEGDLQAAMILDAR